MAFSTSKNSLALDLRKKTIVDYILNGTIKPLP